MFGIEGVLVKRVSGLEGLHCHDSLTVMIKEVDGR